MLQRLTSLFFGSVVETPQEAAPKAAALERDEDDWLLVTVPDGESSVEFSTVSSSTSGTRYLGRSSTENSAANVVTADSADELDVTVPRSSGRVSRGSQAGALSKLVQVGRLQRAQAREDRYGRRHRCVRRQNRVQLRLPRHTRSAVVQQPSHRTYCH